MAFDKPYVIAVIPARGGSKGIPRKNIKMIAGKPLIAWSIESAKESKLIDRIFVSTEDKEIAEFARKYGAEVIDRPKELATDTAPTISAVQHVLQNVKANLVVLLQPTSPVRSKGLIDKCIRQYLETGVESLATGFICKFMEYGTYSKRRQDLEGFFYDDGNVYVINADLIRNGRMVGDKKGHYFTSREENNEIDEGFDFWLVEKILEKAKNKEMYCKKTISIEKIRIGPGQPCLIIAEAGVNHNGDMRLAKQLALVAKQAGADAVKFQTFNPEKLVTKKAGKAEYQKHTTNAAESQLAMLKKLALGENDFVELKKYCEEIGIMFLSTPFDSESVEIVDRLCPIFKISSTDTNNYPFIEQIAKRGKPIILSTGMSTMDEIMKAIDTIRRTGNDQIILLQCVSSYPTPLDQANVAVMLQLMSAGVEIVGYSDHTIGNSAIFAAVALGANVVEKHFTLDKNMEGPDHKASADPKELAELIAGVRNIEKVLGNGIKAPVKCELQNIPIARKKIVAAKEIKKGQKITQEMVEIKRSQDGSEPEKLVDIIGKRAKKDIKIEEGIYYNDYE